MFALGSTGIGKTALLRMIEHQEQNCASLELRDMAMSHISNSDVIQFLQSIDVDLSLFFQALWRHVICIEYIKLIGFAENKDKFRFWSQRICDFITGDKSRQRFEKFLEENTERFWHTLDENVVEFTKGLEQSVTAELGGEVEKFNAHAGYAKHLKTEKKTQLQQRAKKFIDTGTIAELGHVISTLADYMRARQDKYYLLVDKLDEHWVDENIKFHLIHSLFDALQSLRKLKNFKVIVALRSDIYERMIRETPTSLGQLEKYNDLIVRIRWTKEQLWSLAERRINHLFKWRYSSENVHFDDVFLSKVDGRLNVWSYIVARTLFRPRDVINFINFALQSAEGKSSVSKNHLLKAEHAYSDLRLETLKFEWSGTYPGISPMLDLLSGMRPYFLVKEFCGEDLVSRLYDEIGSTEAGQRDQLWKSISNSLAGDTILAPLAVVREVLFRLHLTGAVGIKVSSSLAWQWIYETQKPIQLHSIDLDTRVEIHPMLHFSLHNVERAWKE